jgi:hypothetical protein
MNRTYYKTKFIVTPVYFANQIDEEPVDRLSTIRVVPVFELLDLTNPIIYQVKKGGPQKLVIEVPMWKNIALIYVSDNNLQELVENGAKIIGKPHVYASEVDAKIQMAFVCARHFIEQNDIYEVTEGHMDPQTYGNLVKMFYEDFPEKFV